MEYQSAVQASEGSKGKGPLGLLGKSYALCVYVTVDAEHPLHREMPFVNYHLLNWLSRHKEQCSELILGFSAPISLRDEIQTSVTDLLVQDTEYHEIISRLKTEVELSDPSTGETFQLEFSISYGEQQTT